MLESIFFRDLNPAIPGLVVVSVHRLHKLIAFPIREPSLEIVSIPGVVFSIVHA